MIDDDQARVRLETFLDFIRIDKSVRIKRHIIDFHPILFEMVERTQHGIVLDGRRNGVVPWLKHPKDDQIQRIRGVKRIAQVIRIRSVEERCQHLPGRFDDFSRLHAQIITRPTGIDAKIPVEMIHEGVHFLGFWE